MCVQVSVEKSINFNCVLKQTEVGDLPIGEFGDLSLFSNCSNFCGASSDIRALVGEIIERADVENLQNILIEFNVDILTWWFVKIMNEISIKQI